MRTQANPAANYTTDDLTPRNNITIIYRPRGSSEDGYRIEGTVEQISETGATEVETVGKGRVVLEPDEYGTIRQIPDYHALGRITRIINRD